MGSSRWRGEAAGEMAAPEHGDDVEAVDDEAGAARQLHAVAAEGGSCAHGAGMLGDRIGGGVHRGPAVDPLDPPFARVISDDHVGELGNG